VVVHAISSDENAAQIAADQVRDHIKSAVSLENDIVLNPRVIANRCFEKCSKYQKK
jgi:hypothetical protein